MQFVEKRQEKCTGKYEWLDALVENIWEGEKVITYAESGKEPGRQWRTKILGERRRSAQTRWSGNRTPSWLPCGHNFSARISPQSAPNIQPAKMIEEERLDRNALSHTRSNCWKTKLSLWKEAQDIWKWCGNSTSYKTRTSDKLDETVLMNYDGTILIIWKTSFENKFCVREKAGSKWVWSTKVNMVCFSPKSFNDVWLMFRALALLRSRLWRRALIRLWAAADQSRHSTGCCEIWGKTRCRWKVFFFSRKTLLKATAFSRNIS